MKNLLILFSFILFAACSNQASKNVRIDANSDKALILMGIDKFSRHDIDFEFYQFDSKTGQPTGKTKKVGYRTDQAVSLFDSGRYHVQAFDLPSGHWILAFTYATWSQYDKKKTPLLEGTLAFESIPGRVLHIGDYAVAYDSNIRGNMKRINLNKDAAIQKLAEFKNIDIQVEFGAEKGASFQCASRTNLLGRKVGCDPINIRYNADKKRS